MAPPIAREQVQACLINCRAVQYTIAYNMSTKNITNNSIRAVNIEIIGPSKIDIDNLMILVAGGLRKKNLGLIYRKARALAHPA
jgi:hypothetical protein